MRVAFLCFLLWPLAGAAQDGAAWFPLGPGSTWEYSASDGSSRHRAVDRDTVVDGRFYSVVVETDRGSTGDVVARRELLVRYDRNRGALVEPGAGGERASSLAACSLEPSDTQTVSCMESEGDAEWRLAEGQGVVSASGGAVEVPIRTYTATVGYDAIILARGIGPVLFTEAGTVFVLKDVGGTQPLAEAEGIDVQVWPNPTSDAVRIWFRSESIGELQGDVIDAQGRNVLAFSVFDRQTAFLTLPDAAGVYFIRLFGPSREVVEIITVTHAR